MNETTTPSKSADDLLQYQCLGLELICDYEPIESDVAWLLKQAYGDDVLVLSGIYLSDTRLARDDLSLGAKIIYTILERDMARRGKKFSRLSNDKLASMVGKLSPRTVNRKLVELQAAKLIDRVERNIQRTDKRGRQVPRTIRYIYFDRRRAGYHRRSIAKAKRKMESSYKYFVQMKGMTDKQYVDMKRRWSAEDRAQHEAEKEEREQARLTEFYAESSDEELGRLEVLNGVEKGTFLKVKSEYLDEMRMYDDPAAENDLFEPLDESERTGTTG